MPKINPSKNSAMVLKRCKPFYDWLKQADEKALSSETLKYEGDHSTYLLPGFDTPKDFRGYLKKTTLIILKTSLQNGTNLNSGRRN